MRLTKDYIKAVAEITLKLKKGRTLGVVGESGSGKTTLGKAILCLQKSKGDIWFKGQPLHDLKPEVHGIFLKILNILTQKNCWQLPLSID